MKRVEPTAERKLEIIKKVISDMDAEVAAYEYDRFNEGYKDGAEEVLESIKVNIFTALMKESNKHEQV